MRRESLFEAWSRPVRAQVAWCAVRTVGLSLLLSCLGGRAEAQIRFLGSFQGHDYYRNDSGLTFTNARTAAANLGVQLGATAYLAAVTTTAEQQFLSCAAVGSSFWIGLVRDVNPSTPRNAFRWIWDSGEPYVYDATFWCEGEPSDGGGVEDAGWFNWAPGGCWNDVGPWQGSGTQRSLIEVEPVP